MARMTPEQRRATILAATLAVMARKGIAGTTVRDVAAEMGTSSGLIHHYVSSMDELLATAFEQVADADLRATVADMDRGAGPVERLARFVASYSRADNDAAFQLWLDAWAEAARRPVLRETSMRLNVAWQQLLADTIRTGVEGGAMICADPEATSWRIVSLLDGLSLQVVAHGDALDRRVVHEWGAAYAEHELGLPAGALSRSGPPGRA
jgi:AcrR family transcriptional regulator